MAQHIKIEKEKEPKVFNSVESIGRYLVGGKWYLRSRKPGDTDYIHRKEVIKLSDEYFYGSDKDNFVLLIGSYNLHKKDFAEHSENAKLECHFDVNGNVNNIYYPL